MKKASIAKVMPVSSLKNPPIILIVDDELLIRTIARDTLEESGFRVIEAENGQEALNIVSKECPDLVLLDINMPVLDGFVTCQQLRESPSCKDLPVIMMTRLDDSDSINQAYEVGATDITSKPTNWTTLVHHIRYILRASSTTQQLRENRNFVEKVLDTSAALVVVLDTLWRIERINRACEQLGQYGCEEVVGRSFGTVFFLEQDRAVLQEISQRLSAGEEVCQHESLLVAKNGEHRYVAWSDTQIRNSRGEVTHIIATGVDITANKRAEEQLFERDHFDSLTSLPNRFLFCDRLEQASKQAKRNGSKGAVMLLDLDRFKRINDSFDRLSGDYLLIQVGARWRQSLRETDAVAHFKDDKENATIARIGGDEFSILLSEIGHIQDVAKVAQRLLQVLKEPILLPNGQVVTLSASIGISIFPDDGHESGELLQFSDRAMCHAKQLGGDGYQFYAKEMNVAALQRLLLENDMRQGLERGEFVLYYQPQVDLINGRISSVEALARWEHPANGMIFPADFIPVSLETGLINNLVDWSLETACAQMRKWRAMGISDLRVAVNIPGRQFLQDDLPAKIKSLLERHDLDGRFLELEITENSVMSQEEKSIETLAVLKALGIELSIDDFGTGYSSLSYLNRFPVDTLKIDKSFLHGVPGNIDNCSLIRAIVSMAHSLSLSVVAEGVETAEQLDFMRGTSCEKIQGYFFSRPLPVEEVNLLLLGEVELPPFELLEKKSLISLIGA